MGDHKVALTIDLEPALISEQSDDPGHCHTGCTQGTGHLLVSQTQIQAQSLVTGLTVILGKQLKKSPDSLLNTTKSEKRQQIFRLPMP